MLIISVSLPYIQGITSYDNSAAVHTSYCCKGYKTDLDAENCLKESPGNSLPLAC